MTAHMARPLLASVLLAGLRVLSVLPGAQAASTQVTRGTCSATLSNTSSQATSTVNAACAIGTSSFWVRHQQQMWVSGAPILVWTSKGYHSGNGVARSPSGSPLIKSEHRITNGAVPDPGYTYTLTY